MKKLFLSILLLLSINVFSVNRYVTTTGSTYGAGTISDPWTLQYAVSNYLPGDSIFVKSGNYGAVQLVFTVSGTTSNRVVFKGYKNNPNEYIFPIADMNADYSTFTGFNVLTMPTLIGSSYSNTAFNLDNVSNITIQNFQVSRYKVGFSTGKTGSISNNGIYFENCNVHNISISGIELGDFMDNKYSKKSRIYNSLAINCSYEGFTVSGDSNEVIGCRVYCSTTGTGATDYYIAVVGSYNLIQSCRVSKINGLSHIGYGIVIRSNFIEGTNTTIGISLNSISNSIRFCIADKMGESFCVKHPKTKFNKFYRCTAYGSSNSVENNSGIVFKDGARENKFESMYISACTHGITSTYSSWYSGGSDSPNFLNEVLNSLFDASFNQISFPIYSQVNSNAGPNKIVNNTFYKCKNMFLANNYSGQMYYLNNIWDVNGGVFSNGPQSSSITANQFNYCDIYGVSIPFGLVNNCISANPLFMAPNNQNLQVGSPCKTSGFFSLQYDYNLAVRTNPTSMGCFK